MHNFYDVYIDIQDGWRNIGIYQLAKGERGSCLISYPDGMVRKDIANEETLRIYPFSVFTFKKYDKLRSMMQHVGDLVCSFLGRFEVLNLPDLSSKIEKACKSEFGLDEMGVEWVIRCLVAAKFLLPVGHDKFISFSLHSSLKKRESQRKFASSVAADLDFLSERIGYICNHGPTIGTYREGILQSCLKRHIPERYHIATGFVYGVNRQVDILIYDRIDYSPIFREGDLVVVPPESVRAVIEVKTNLTKSNINSALDLLDELSKFDDNWPPFFKGVFAFGSSIGERTLYKYFLNFYSDLACQSQGGPGVLICNPFQHMTCMCVNRKAFAYVDYAVNENNRLIPTLYSKGSVAGFESQASFFIQKLLSYLKYGGVKGFKRNYNKIMLGADVYTEAIGALRGESWGRYYSYDEGELSKDDLLEMEDLIISVKNWIDGEENYENISAFIK